MHYKLNGNIVVFYLSRRLINEQCRSVHNFAETRLTEANIKLICDTICKKGRGLKYQTQATIMKSFLSKLISFCKAKYKKPLPTTSDSDDWQMFVLSFLQFYLTDMEHSVASAKSRIISWRSAGSMLKFWIEEGIVPIDVYIPNLVRKEIQSPAKPQMMLGQSEAQSTAVHDAPQKLLVNIDFARTDADYLDSIERDCREKIKLLKDVCHEHWKALRQDMQKGKEIADSISHEEIEQSINSGALRNRSYYARNIPWASPKNPIGYKLGIALCRHSLLTGKDRECISKKSLRTLPFVKMGLPTAFQQLRHLTAMPEHAFNILDSHSFFLRFVGVLSNVDIAAAICLLIIEHPQFNPDSLIHATVSNARGKTHLLETDQRGVHIFTVDKPRARKRKSAVLSPRAQQLVQEILLITEPVRRILKQAGNESWRNLFLGHGMMGRLQSLNPTAKTLNSHSETSLVKLYPQLESGGLTFGTFDYRRIRNTQGVLAWFESGSIHEMSRRLGNSDRTVLEHYLPSSLLYAWNSRIIRRFQNTLIVLAVHNEDYLLDVTDFSTFTDLQHFMAQLIVEYPGDSSPLASEVQSRLGTYIEHGKDNTNSLAPGLLNIHLSSNSLAYLYAFSEFAVKRLNNEELDCIDSQTKLCARQFVDLARLFAHACEGKKTSIALRELLDLASLQAIHRQAIHRVPILLTKLSNLAINNRWEDHHDETC